MDYIETERGINRLLVKLDEGAFMPERAHKTDAGLDLKSPEAVIVPAKESAVIHTGVHIGLPFGTVGFLKSKSGLNVKNGITSEGVIDEGYTGEIVVKLYNHGGYDVRIERGQKITQLVILPVVIPDIRAVDKLPDEERGDNGFGSSGK